MEENRTNISKSFLIRDLLRDLIEENNSDEGNFLFILCAEICCFNSSQIVKISGNIYTI